jgi:hypothetical protein
MDSTADVYVWVWCVCSPVRWWSSWPAALLARRQSSSRTTMTGHHPGHTGTLWWLGCRRSLARSVLAQITAQRLQLRVLTTAPAADEMGTGGSK